MNKMTFDKMWQELKDSDPDNKDFLESCEDIANIIHTLSETRINKGLTQHDLAKISNMNQAVISRTESLNTMPKLNTIVTLARALGLKITLEDNINESSDCT